MITFKQFLGEGEETDLVKVINKQCAEFLSQTHRAGLLVRGMRSLGPASNIGHFANPLYKGGNRARQDTVIEYALKAPRSDRKPSDTPRRIHVILDRWFNQHFGVNARSAATFCYGEKSRDQVLQYGTAYAVFPVGDFKIIWSPKIADLYGDVETELLPKIRRGEFDDEETAISEWMMEQDYTDSKPVEAIKSNMELMLICSKYYAFAYSDYASMLHEVLDIAK